MDNPIGVQGMAAIAVTYCSVSTYVVCYPTQPPSGRKPMWRKGLCTLGPARPYLTPYAVRL